MEVSSRRVGTRVENEPRKDGGDEGKLYLIGSRKNGVESKLGKRKQTWRPMAERVRLRVLGVMQCEIGAIEDFGAREWLGQINRWQNSFNPWLDSG